MADKTDKVDKATKAYRDWLATLPLATAALLGDRDDASEFAEFASSLSREASEKLAVLAGAEPEPETDAEAPSAAVRYGLVVCESGEFPVVKLFKTAESMADHVGKLEGEDVCVVCFYGQFLPVTTGPPRHIILGDQVVSVPCPGAPKPVVSGSGRVFDDLEHQVDGFLGPVELAQTYDVSEPAPSGDGRRDDGDDDGVESHAG